MAEESFYVLFGNKGDYRLSIRTPALNFGGARIHIDREDGGLVFTDDVKKAFDLKGSPPTKEKLGSYVTVSYDLYADTKTGVETAFIDRRAIGHHPEVLLTPFIKCLEYLESRGAKVQREVALTVYGDTLKESLEVAGFYPPKGLKPEKLERISAKFGGISVKNDQIIKEGK